MVIGFVWTYPLICCTISFCITSSWEVPFVFFPLRFPFNFLTDGTNLNSVYLKVCYMVVFLLKHFYCNRYFKSLCYEIVLGIKLKTYSVGIRIGCIVHPVFGIGPMYSFILFLTVPFLLIHWGIGIVVLIVGSNTCPRLLNLVRDHLKRTKKDNQLCFFT